VTGAMIVLRMAVMRFVIVPGIGGSGPAHWQSIWQTTWGASATRIVPASWDNPDLDDWCRAIDDAVTAHRPNPCVLVAHSLGCLAATAWVARRQASGVGLFLVAPPDVAGPIFPRTEAESFAAVAPIALDAPGLVVTSDDDPYCTIDAAQRLVEKWRLDHVSAGNGGHLNGASGLGDWEFGRALLATVVTRLP